MDLYRLLENYHLLASTIIFFCAEQITDASLKDTAVSRLVSYLEMITGLGTQT